MISLFSSSKKADIRKILLNINIIAIAVGLVFMISGVRLPKFAKEVVSSLGNMLGIVGMIIAGMLAAEISFKKIFRNKRLYLVLIMRMVFCPVVVLVTVKCVCMTVSIANVQEILLISFLASITPSAATIMQFAKLKNKDSDFAVAINIVTTLVCVVTMPIFVTLYFA